MYMSPIPFRLKLCCKCTALTTNIQKVSRTVHCRNKERNYLVAIGSKLSGICIRLFLCSVSTGDFSTGTSSNGLL